MKIKFYGTRGSIPVCNRDYQAFGGDTTCVLVQTQNNIGILDAGTGIRQLGKDLVSCKDYDCKQIYMAFSHFHWDHIQGFPFFLPAYDKDRKIIISVIGKSNEHLNIQEILGGQMKQEYFPVPMKQMGAKMRFSHINSDEYKSSKFNVRASEHIHPGGAYTYRIDSEGKSVVYCTDVEHPDGIDERVVEIAENADVLIHEAQYTSEELKYKKGWGHSSYEQAIEVARLANVKKLFITHHDPDHNDSFLSEEELKCKYLFDDVSFARDGLEWEI